MRENLHHLSGKSLDEVATAPPELRVLKAGKNSHPNTLATSIALVTAAGEPPTLWAKGSLAVNQAVKALAVCRMRTLRERFGVTDWDLVCYVTFRDRVSGAVSLRLAKYHRVGGADGSPPPPVQPVAAEGRRLGFEMRVGKTTDPMSIAGAIANRVRKGQRVHLTCVGHEARGPSPPHTHAHAHKKNAVLCRQLFF